MTTSLLLLAPGSWAQDAGLDAPDACLCDAGDAECSCSEDVGPPPVEEVIEIQGPPLPNDWPTKSTDQKALVKDLYLQTKDINKDLETVLKKLEKKAKKKAKREAEAKKELDLAH